MARIVWALVAFAGLAGLYLFLAGSVDGVELAAMVLCAGAGVALAALLAVVAKRHYALLPPLGPVLRPFAQLLPETFVTGRALVAAALGGRKVAGALVEQPFEPGADDPRSSTRRALTVIGVSLAPRTFVVHGERTQALLLHGLPVKAPSPDRAWPT